MVQGNEILAVILFLRSVLVKNSVIKVSLSKLNFFRNCFRSTQYIQKCYLKSQSEIFGSNDTNKICSFTLHRGKSPSSHKIQF